MKTRAATLGALVLSTIVAHAAAAAGAARLTVFNGATCRENGGTQLLALTSPGSGQCGTVPATPISYTVTCDADGNGGSAFVCDGSSCGKSGGQCSSPVTFRNNECIGGASLPSGYERNSVSIVCTATSGGGGGAAVSAAAGKGSHEMVLLSLAVGFFVGLLALLRAM